MIHLDWTLAVWLRLASRLNEALRPAVVRMSRSRCCNTRTGTRCKAQSLRKNELDGWDILIQRLSVRHGDAFAVVCAIWLSCFGTISVKTKPKIQFLYVIWWNKEFVMIRLVIIGPLHYPVTWYGINYAGTQITQWDFQSIGTRTSPARFSFVLKVPLRYLRLSIIYSVPSDWILQRVGNDTWKWIVISMTRAWDKEKGWVPERNGTHDLPNTGGGVLSTEPREHMAS